MSMGGACPVPHPVFTGGHVNSFQRAGTPVPYEAFSQVKHPGPTPTPTHPPRSVRGFEHHLRDHARARAFVSAMGVSDTISSPRPPSQRPDRTQCAGRAVGSYVGGRGTRPDLANTSVRVVNGGFRHGAITVFASQRPHRTRCAGRVAGSTLGDVESGRTRRGCASGRAPASSFPVPNPLRPAVRGRTR